MAIQISTFRPLRQQVGRGISLSDSGKPETLAECLEAQFQRMDDPSYPAVFEMAYEAMHTCQYAVGSEPKLRNSWRFNRPSATQD